MIKKNNSLTNDILPWIAVGILSIAVIFVAFFFKEDLAEFRSLGLLGIFLANFFASATLFLPAPGIATVIAGGSIYPPLLVGIVATLGAVVGDLGGYIIGFSGKSIITRKKHPKKYDTFVKLFQRWGGLLIFIFALVPNPLFDGVSLIAGGLGYPAKKFVIYLFLGRLIRNMLLSFLGYKLL